MSSIRSILRHAASVAVVASATAAGPAHAVSIDVGSYTKSGLGAEFATSYDVELVLGAGSAAYEQGCAQFISTLAAMGLASRQSSQSVSEVHR